MSKQLSLMTPAAASENVAATTAKANIENCTGVIARGPGDFVGQLDRKSHV